MVRFAILGMGFMGVTHYEALQRIDGAEVTVIASPSERKARGDMRGVSGNIGDELPEQLPMDRMYGTTDLHAALRRDDVDVVDICVPTPYHAEYATAALNAGKHVICEKPLAATVADAEPIVQAARNATAFFMPAMCMRFWPAWQWIKQAADHKTYGNVQSATFIRNTTQPAGWFLDGSQSGGAAMDLHIHDTDYVHWLLGTPRAVTSRGYAGVTGQTDHIATFYHYDDVPLVYAEASWTLAPGSGFDCRATVNFERATAHFDIAGEGSGLKLAKDGELTPIECPAHDGWEGQLRYLVDCVQRGERPSVVDADAALESMRTVEAECQSVAAGSVVQR